MITLRHEYDPDLQIILAPPTGDAFEDVYSAWFDRRGDKREFFSNMELARACAVEPKGEALSALFRAWSGLAMAAGQHCTDIAERGCETHTPLDVRKLLDGSEESEIHLAAMKAQGIERVQVETWLRAYPRKGPPGKAQLVVALFSWGYYVCRSPEPQEWFDVEGLRGNGQHYATARQWVKSCTLFPSVPDVLARNKTSPALIVILGSIVRMSAGEGLAKLVGESSGA
jgi:hypothetical protein